MIAVHQSQTDIEAPIEKVRDFHKSSMALKLLTPPPIWVQFHRVDPLEEGSIAEFTMWLILIPLRWQAIHHQVNPNGFIDEQKKGPLKFWKHEHCFESTTDNKTKIIDTVHYQHRGGLSGIFSRLFFNSISLKFLFFYRYWVTRKRLSGRGG